MNELTERIRDGACKALRHALSEGLPRCVSVKNLGKVPSEGLTFKVIGEIAQLVSLRPCSGRSLHLEEPEPLVKGDVLGCSRVLRNVDGFLGCCHDVGHGKSCRLV